MSGADHGERLVAFFQRLGSLEPILRIILHDASMSAELTFRGAEERTVLLDFTRRPARISAGRPREPGQIRVTIDGAVMHEVMIGRLSPGEALGRRQLLLRGAPSALARFIPLLDFAPLLYRDHVAHSGAGVGAGAAVEEDPMDGSTGRQGPLVRRLARQTERALERLVGELAYGVGYGMGQLRYRFLRQLSLFEVLSAMARGVEAASPPPAAQGGRRQEAS